MSTDSKRADLWGDIEIPVIVGTGEFSSGKTLFGLGICPGSQTLVFDNEGSSLTYKAIGFDHVDMVRELSAKYPNGFTSEQRFLWWKDEIVKRGKTGKYRVAVVDPASEIEDGLADHVRANVGRFGLTQSQCDKSPALFWGVMKKEWKVLIDTLRTYYETIYFTVHLRDEFKAGAPTGKREPKGKETLFELASLFLWFCREIEKESGQPTKVPSARVLKSRLAKATVAADGELAVVPVLPPRLARATPKEIRRYVAIPPDYSNLLEEERVRDQQMSEDERLMIQASIAANRAEAVRAEAALVERRMQAAEIAKANAERAANSKPDMSAEYAANKAAKTAASAVATIAASEKAAASGEKSVEKDAEKAAEKVAEKATDTSPPAGQQEQKSADSNPTEPVQSAIATSQSSAVASPAKCTTSQLQELDSLRSKLRIPDAQWRDGIAKRTGGSQDPRDLTTEKANEVIAVLRENVEKQQKKAAAQAV